MRRNGLILSVVIALLPLASACGPDKNDHADAAGPDTPPAAGDTIDNKITGDVREYRVSVSDSKAKAGDVTYTITNYGTITHEFLIVKTDIAPGQIPIGPENKFDEEQDGIDVVDEISEFEPGTTGTVTLRLEPGKYQLVCNIPGHYAQGMYVPFEVVG